MKINRYPIVVFLTTLLSDNRWIDLGVSHINKSLISSRPVVAEFYFILVKIFGR